MNSGLAEQLAAIARLEADDPARAGDAYAALLDREPACLEASNALERLAHPRRFSAWMQINCVIHPSDDIFRFIGRGPHGQNPVRAYLADGWRTLAELMLVLERLDRSLLKTGSMLEFACGFGRFTRHLAPLLPGRLDCADVLPGSVEFVREQFGVGAFESDSDPDKIDFPRRYSLIFVLSLFTHLPVEDWGAWLRALTGALEPGGVLLFSVHSEALALEQGVRFDDSGVHFVPRSESPSLDPARYGTTFTTRKVVERSVFEALGQRPDLYAPAAFWAGQDAIAVVAERD